MARQYALSAYLSNRPYNYTSKVFGRFCKMAQNDYYLRHVIPSICPHGITGLLVEGFS